MILSVRRIVLKQMRLGALDFGRVIASQSEASHMSKMSILREISISQSNSYTQQQEPAGEALLIPSQLQSINPRL